MGRAFANAAGRYFLAVGKRERVGRVSVERSPGDATAIVLALTGRGHFPQ